MMNVLELKEFRKGEPLMYFLWGFVLMTSALGILLYAFIGNEFLAITGMLGIMFSVITGFQYSIVIKFDRLEENAKDRK